MSLQVRAGVAQGGQVFHGEEATVCQHRVQARRIVALAEHKAITVCHFGICGINVHLLEVQIGEHIGRRQASAGVAALCAVGGFNNTHAHLAGGNLQLLLFRFCHSYLLNPGHNTCLAVFSRFQRKQPKNAGFSILFFIISYFTKK